MRSQAILALPLSLCLLLFFARCVSGYSPYYLQHNCNSEKGKTTQEGLDNLLRNLGQNLKRNASSPNYAVASNDSPSLFTLLQCRRDLPVADCAQCLADAAAELGRRCPLQVDAMVWFDGCFLRYNDHSFFSRLDTEYYYDFWNPSDSNNSVFLEKRKELMPALACEAMSSGAAFSMGSRDYNSTHKIYGLVQCNQDITMNDCSKCLKVAVDRILGACQQDWGKNCEAKIGRRPLMKNCYIQYEQDMFFNNNLKGVAKSSKNCYIQYDQHGCIFDS